MVWWMDKQKLNNVSKASNCFLLPWIPFPTKNNALVWGLNINYNFKYNCFVVKIKCVTTLALSLQPRSKNYIKCIQEQVKIRNELARVKRDPTIPSRCRKSLGIKGEHPYLIPMVNSLIWKLEFVNNFKCSTVDFKS